MHMSTVIKITGSVIVNWMKQVCLQTIQSLMCTTSTSKSDNIPALLYTLNINQSKVSTKLKRHDFVIPEIEVTSQLIDLRSSATLCWSVKVRPWPCRRWQFEGTVVSNVPSGVWHIDCILITWLTRRSRRIRIVRLKEINLARWVSYAVDIVSGHAQCSPDQLTMGRITPIQGYRFYTIISENTSNRQCACVSYGRYLIL